MAKPKKTVNTSTFLAYSLETGIPKTFLIEKAVKKYLDEKEKQGDE